MLKRDEQATFVRIFSSLVTSGRSVAEALYQIADDYKDRGLIDAELPSFLKRFQKGYVASLIEEVAYDITQGVRPSEALSKASFLDEDVRKSLARAMESGEVEKMSTALADILEQESKLRGKIKTLAITPAMVILVFFLIVYVVCFKLAPAISSVVSHPERLPAGARLALYVNQHSYIYFLLVGGISFLIFVFVKSGVWKKLIPAFNDFERLRFLSWLRILSESGMNLYEALLFLENSGFKKEFRTRIEEAIADLEAGQSAENVIDSFRGLLSSVDRSFLKAGIKTGDLSRELLPLLRVLKVEVEKSMEKSTQLINTAMMITGGGMVLGIYGGVIVPLTMGIQKAM